MDTSGRLTASALATAAASAGVAFCAQAIVWRAAGAAVPGALLVSALLVVGVFHLVCLLLLAGRSDDRTWEATVFTVPVALGLFPGFDRRGGLGLVVLLIVASAAVVAYGRWGKRRGTPILASAAGGLAGPVIFAWLAESRLGAGAQVVLAAGAVTLTAMLVGLRLPRKGGHPSVRTSLTITAAALVVAGATALGGAPPFPPPPGPIVGGMTDLPSVALIVLDTVRADHLESYGYPRRTMPNLARFAGRYTTRVERAIANAPSSLASHASFFTGVTPARHGAHKPFVDDPDPPHYAYPLGPELATLAELLGTAGYWTVGVAANPGPLDPAYGIGRGFDAYTASPGVLGERHLRRMCPWRGATRRRWPLAFLDRFPPFSRCEFFGPSVAFRRATAITDTAIRVVDLAGDRPFFLFVNYFDAHFPYRPPYFFADTFPRASQPGVRQMTDWRRVFHRIANGGPMRPDEREELRDTYDSQLHYLDSELARLLDRLERHHHFGTMLVIITSDHGEALGEHGLLFHSVQLYDEVLRVPLFIKPGRSAPADFRAGAVVPGPFQSVDVFATILDHAEVAAPAGLDGVPWGAGRRVMLAETYVHQDALRQVGPVLARELHALERDGWRLVVSSRGELELYDIRRDPAELENRTADEPARAETLARELEASLGRGRLSGAPKPQRDAPNDALRERLRALGYAE